MNDHSNIATNISEPGATGDVQTSACTWPDLVLDHPFASGEPFAAGQRVDLVRPGPRPPGWHEGMVLVSLGYPAAIEVVDDRVRFGCVSHLGSQGKRVNKAVAELCKQYLRSVRAPRLAAGLILVRDEGVTGSAFAIALVSRDDLHGDAGDLFTMLLEERPGSLPAFVGDIYRVYEAKVSAFVTRSPAILQTAIDRVEPARRDYVVDGTHALLRGLPPTAGKCLLECGDDTWELRVLDKQEKLQSNVYPVEERIEVVVGSFSNPSGRVELIWREGGVRKLSTFFDSEANDPHVRDRIIDRLRDQAWAMATLRARAPLPNVALVRCEDIELIDIGEPIAQQSPLGFG